MRALLAGGALAAIATAMVYSAPPASVPRMEQGAFYVRLVEHRDGGERTSHWARRGDGWLAHTTSKESRELISGTGTVIIVSDPVKARSTFDRVSRGLSPFASPASNCAQVDGGRPTRGQPAGETSIEGQRVVMFQELRNPRVRWTDWAAPELGCLVLQSTGEIRKSPDEPWRLAVYLKTEAVESGTYPNWMFSLPPDYREMSPGQVVSLITNGRGESSDALRSVDASYYANPARMNDASRQQTEK
ncbi:hypothetical protein [uncultured Paludibaculum sp.]|uniref:hypothetical protein n=1 Tax=uncultured Paludibaculum sp. TaxID=1765020 RepID=UPI002AAB21C2|nr:hypothetical protein [uncultured Paludibaculum sp.]